MPSNRNLLFVLSSVLGKFIEVAIFLALFIYFWARIGCWLFGDNKQEIVLEEIYDPSSGSIATFDDLKYAVLTLIQLMVGAGWHQIMYTNTIATTKWATLYFIVYIMFVSIIITNIFVGLLLANVDELQEKQIHDEIAHRSIKTKSFKKFAKKKQEMLKYQIENHLDQAEALKKELGHIKKILERQKRLNND